LALRSAWASRHSYAPWRVREFLHKGSVRGETLPRDDFGFEHSSLEIGQAIAQSRSQCSITNGKYVHRARGHPIAIGMAMCRPLRKAVLATSLLALPPLSPLWAQKLDQLVPRNVALSQMTYQGRSAVQLIAAPDAANGSSYAILKNASFRDGTIEVDLAGKPATGTGAGARGFIGIAF
jgi:hypothetical protein